jgi:hypothetical protein
MAIIPQISRLRIHEEISRAIGTGNEASVNWTLTKLAEDAYPVGYGREDFCNGMEQTKLYRAMLIAELRNDYDISE